MSPHWTRDHRGWRLKSGERLLAEVWRPKTHQAYFIALFGTPFGEHKFYEPNEKAALETAERKLREYAAAITAVLP